MEQVRRVQAREQEQEPEQEPEPEPQPEREEEQTQAALQARAAQRVLHEQVQPAPEAAVARLAQAAHSLQGGEFF